MSAGYGCWAMGCRHVADYVVRNIDTPLVKPVESCRDHVGGLLGNAGKAALSVLGAREVTLKVTRLV